MIKLLLLSILIPFSSFAQNPTPGEALNQADLISNVNTFSVNASGFDTINTAIAITKKGKEPETIALKTANLTTSIPPEKLYLQFDRPYYSLGDTIWFKAWLFRADYFLPSFESGLLYVELTNDSNKLIKRIMLPVASGLSWGNITLAEKEIPEGNYTLRAYTNWMRNFDEGFIFKKDFYFSNTIKNNWLVNTKVNLANENGVDKAHLKLKFSQLNKEPLILKDMELQVLNGEKQWYNRKIETKIDGNTDVTFDLKSPTKQVTIVAKGLAPEEQGDKLIIPVEFNRVENLDLQFMPEGGNLVAGLPAYVGFKAIGEDGKGINVIGNIYNDRQQLSVSFKSTHNGMGVFELQPVFGEHYTAKIILPGGIIKMFKLPQVNSTGTSLKIRAPQHTDSLTLTVTSTQENGTYYLTGMSRGIVCYSTKINLSNHEARAIIPTSVFPAGIARFTLANAANVPLNDRIVFIDHHDKLQISIKTDKASYRTRDSIALKIKVSDKDGHPVKGNFAISITDNSQVKIDSLNNGTICSNLLLSSDLKGTIESPDYYFQADTDGTIKQQLDNLLLTQGWVAYNWKDTIKPEKQTLYKAEPEFTISGKVKNIFNKPLINTSVILFSKKPALVIDTITDKDGNFNFKNIIPIDTPVFIIQARNKNGRSFNVGVNVEEFIPPAFNSPAKKIVPWYVNTDTALITIVKNNIVAKNNMDIATGGGSKVLKEVVISSKKFIRDSQNPNGPGNADIVIDEKELEKAGKKTWLQLLREKVPGFKESFMLLAGPPEVEKIREDRIFAAFIVDDIRLAGLGGNNQSWYYINGKPVKFIIDGVSLYKVMPITLPAITNINDYLNSHSAEDIKGIEVNSSTKYASQYLPAEWVELVRQSDIAFVEITTRSGGGPGVANTPGTYIYKPLPFSLPKQFYSPKYIVKDKDNTTKDYRSTIYWQPNVVTDSNGEATVSFFAADNKGSYSVVIEGTDWNGSFGSKRTGINIIGN